MDVFFRGSPTTKAKIVKGQGQHQGAAVTGAVRTATETRDSERERQAKLKIRQGLRLVLRDRKSVV